MTVLDGFSVACRNGECSARRSSGSRFYRRLFVCLRVDAPKRCLSDIGFGTWFVGSGGFMTHGRTRMPRFRTDLGRRPRRPRRPPRVRPAPRQRRSGGQTAGRPPHGEAVQGNPSQLAPELRSRLKQTESSCIKSSILITHVNFLLQKTTQPLALHVQTATRAKTCVFHGFMRVF